MNLFLYLETLSHLNPPLDPLHGETNPIESLQPFWFALSSSEFQDMYQEQESIRFENFLFSAF
jgi:hypothetical protein